MNKIYVKRQAYTTLFKAKVKLADCACLSHSAPIQFFFYFFAC